MYTRDTFLLRVANDQQTWFHVPGIMSVQIFTEAEPPDFSEISKDQENQSNLIYPPGSPRRMEAKCENDT